jgi:HEAT repeat protein
MLQISKSNALFAVLLAAVCGIAAPAAAQTPRLTNANMRPVALSGALTAQFKALVDQQVEPAWIAYTQPIIDGTLASCCYGWSDNGSGQSTCCVGCPIEGRSGVVSITDHTVEDGAARQAPQQPIKLEGATDFVMLFRIENRRIDRVRVYSADCALDAGGRTVHAITGVKSSDSLALLESLATTWPVTTSRKTAPDSLISGIAFHRDPAADGVLKKLLEPSQPDDVRRRATFWLARARGRAGFEAVRRMMRDDPNERVRKHAVFAITQSREPEVVPVLIEAARTSPQADVRGEALFWLAQRAGKQAAEAITRAIEQDPDTEVKVRAVAALGQLPKEEGVPLLINVARTNTNPAVRKRAMHWLGQSKDPRAIDFFESVLK